MPVELGPTLGLDLALEIATDVEIGAQPQFLRDEVLGAGAHALLDIVAGDHEVLAIIGAAAQDDVDVWVVGVPVIDAGPVERRAKVLFHLPHQIAGEGFEVRHVHGVLGRDDEPEMMPVLVAALGEGAAVHLVALRPEQTGLLAVTGHALAAQVAEMRRERRGAGAMTNHSGLDHDAAGPAGQKAVGANTCRPTTSKGRAVARADPAGTRDTGSCLLGGGERLRDEGSRALRTGGAAPARPDAEVVLALHGRAPTHRAKSRKCMHKRGCGEVREFSAPRKIAP